VPRVPGTLGGVCEEGRNEGGRREGREGKVELTFLCFLAFHFRFHSDSDLSPSLSRNETSSSEQS